jgi:hypothetical protein
MVMILLRLRKVGTGAVGLLQAILDPVAVSVKSFRLEFLL